MRQYPVSNRHRRVARDGNVAAPPVTVGSPAVGHPSGLPFIGHPPAKGSWGTDTCEYGLGGIGVINASCIAGKGLVSAAPGADPSKGVSVARSAWVSPFTPSDGVGAGAAIVDR